MKKLVTNIVVINPQAYFPEGTLIPESPRREKESKKVTDPKVEYSF